MNMLNNNCHTLSRYSCYEKKEDIEKLSKQWTNIMSAHVSYNAESCLIDDLPGTYISVSFAVIALLAFLF